MKVSKEIVLRILDALQEGMNVLREERRLSAKQAGYIHGYEDALKNIRFILDMVDD